MLDIWLMNVADLNHLLKFYTSSLIIVYQVTRWYCNREDKLVSNLARKYAGSRNFTACIVYTTIVCWHLYTYCTGKIFWSLRYIGPRYNAVALYNYCVSHQFINQNLRNIIFKNATWALMDLHIYLTLFTFCVCCFSGSTTRGTMEKPDASIELDSLASSLDILSLGSDSKLNNSDENHLKSLDETKDTDLKTRGPIGGVPVDVGIYSQTSYTPVQSARKYVRPNKSSFESKNPPTPDPDAMVEFCKEFVKIQDQTPLFS